MSFLTGLIIVFQTILLFFVFFYFRNKLNTKKELFLKEGHSKGWQECREDQAKMREFLATQRQKNFLHVGSKVIGVPNEWQDFTVGEIHSFLETASGPCLDAPLIQDEISGELSGGGITIPYTPEILNALIKLDPFERWSLLVASHALSKDQYIFDKKKVYEGSEPSKVHTSEELVAILGKKGLIPL